MAVNNLKPFVKELLTLKTPLPKKLVEQRANCFNAVQIYWSDCKEASFLGPEEFVSYIQQNFSQISLNASIQCGDVSIVWSRSSTVLPVGQIAIDSLLKKKEGYPFGLIIEHAFVSITANKVFQKQDPTANGPYKILDENSALEPYRNLEGFEVTRHRRRL